MYSDQVILHYLKYGASRFANAPAIEGDVTLTYAQVDDGSDRIAAALLRRGVAKGECVGVGYDHSGAAALSVLGILKAGAAYVPLNPDYPPARLLYMKNDAGIKIVLGGPDGLNVFSLAEEEKAALPEVMPDDRMAVIYTSGSAGVPKGVALTHKNPMESARYYAKTVGLKCGDRMAAYASLSFIVAMNDLCSSLMAGAALHYVPRDVRSDMRRMADFFEREGIAHVIIPASVGRGFARVVPPGQVRSMCFVGEPFVPPETIPDFRIYNGYGSTEVAGIAAMGTSVKLRAIDGVAARTNRRGELILSGPCVGEGYIGAAGRFDGEFNTGDLAEFDESGEFIVSGRADFQVKIRGHRIQLEEVDSHARNFRDVKEAAAVLKGNRLAIYFSGNADPDALKRHLEQSLPGYMVPSEVIRMERLPHNSSGKIDRLALGRTSPAGVSGGTQFQTETERRLARIWDVLLESKDPGRDDAFEDSGGDSLTVMLLALEIESEFGKTVSPAKLFEAATLKEQAKLIDNAEPDRIAAYNKSGGLPPLFFVHTANSGAEVYRGFLSALPIGQPVYIFENYNMLFSDGNFEGITMLARRYAGYLPTLSHYRLGGWSVGGLIAFEMGLILQERGISSELYLIDPYIITSDEERELSRVLETDPYFQDYLERNALFERFRAAGLLERMISNNNFIQHEVTHYMPAKKFTGRTVLFKAMKPDFGDSGTLRRLWEMRSPDNGFAGFTKDLRVIPVESTHDSCMSDPQTLRVIISEIDGVDSANSMLPIAATDENLEAVQDFIAQKMRKNGFAPKAIMQTLIAVEEIFINIAHYAYYNRGSAEITFFMIGESAVITFVDYGKPYNPLEKAEPDITLPADERPVGGLGIFMMRRLTDAVEYRRANGRNILSIRKIRDNNITES